MIKPLSVLVIGGYGEFGGRLSELLLRDGHGVIVAGRQLEKATQFCQQYGGEALQLDINTDLDKIAPLDVDVVVDAAGPFQSYDSGSTISGSEHRYRVALSAIECGARYLDLSDDGEFAKGISTLDAVAKERGRFALSGASSTPALSGAAVTAMAEQFSAIEKIETSIMPGSRAPQGYSVMQAILAQIGNPVPFWRNNEWIDCTGWSEPSIKSTSDKVTRSANLITAADVVLFPTHFKANSVLFRAGLAVPIMHKSLQWLGALRKREWLPVLTRFVKPLRWLAYIITPFGNDHGGMLVEVVGEPTKPTDSDNARLQQSSWILNAKPGEGPYVPTIAVRSILQHIDTIKPGARACINELPLNQLIAAMNDIDVTTHMHNEEFRFLFQHVLNEHWQLLPACLRDTHKFVDRKILTGSAKVTRGTSPLTQLVAWLFRFPAASDNIPVTVVKTRCGKAEIWDRDFAGQKFRSTLTKLAPEATPDNQCVVQEQFGLLKFVLNLPIEGDIMHMNVLRGSCLGVPIPSWFLPISNTQEFAVNNRMHFCVELLGPLKTGLIVRYEGSLE